MDYGCKITCSLYPHKYKETTIQYAITEASPVKLAVYDILGNWVATVVNEDQTAGSYRAYFNADNLPSGMYFARLTANEFTQVLKMTFLK